MKIRIQNFQAFADAQFEASGFTAIVGPSNLGKSAAIRAIISAMFNRPGEEFVRLGHTVSHVEIENLPGWDRTLLNVKWSKGHNVNEFDLDGDLYKKVGVGAPPVLQDAGYRDIWIGDRDRSKGESIRPQVAEQFDRLFLLDRPGSFISDVLSVISRLAVLLRAHQRSSSDLKSQKQMLGVRRKDLDAADAKLAAMSPIVDLYARVAALAPQMERLKRDQALVESDIRPLVVRRGVLAPFAGLTVPAQKATALEKESETYLKAFDLVETRRGLLPLAQATLPSPATTAKAPALFQEADRYEALVKLAAQRRLYAPLCAQAIPEAKAIPLVKLDAAVKHVDKIRELAEERTQAYAGHFDAVRALKSITDEEKQNKQELTDFLAGLQICPVCDRPMEVSAAAV